MAISEDTAALVAAQLVRAVTDIKTERHRQLGAYQSDPETDVAKTYSAMLRLVQSGQLPR